MRLSDPIKISYKNLMAAKFRSFLTILGIIIGVGSVIIVMAVGASAQALILDQVKSIGSNLIGILPGASEEKGPPASVFGAVTTTLKYEDLEAILKKKNVPNAIAAAGYVSGSASIKKAENSFQTSYQGVTASFTNVEDVKVGKGRFFTKEEEINLSRVVVLGFNRAKDLFPDDDPINKSITIKDLNFTVIGVMEERGAVAFSGTDDLVYLPLFTAQKLLLGIDYLNFARVKVDNQENMDKAAEDIKATLREQHNLKGDKENDFSVRNSAQALSIISGVTDVLKYFLVSIAAISLLVGGVGIMNIMLIAVNQRIREIGLRKAVGAKNFHIIWQFLIESIVITFFGGLIGIIIGITISFLVAVTIRALDYSWQFIITWQSIVLAFSVTAAIGLLFGIYPARKASRVSPMEALRYE
ncbi:MAG: ABC transporter permease [Candidatus Moranbacteria bacterium]|nr:ABC transporter permease [Candidatus Moranbacteria bacterium]